MRDPLDKMIIIRDFQGHINAGGTSAKFPGIDFEASIGTPCYAVENGYMYCANDHLGGNRGGANYIMLNGSHGSWFYVHLDRFARGNGPVKEGDLIGYTGNTGIVTGPHLHFGLKVSGRYVDPGPYLRTSNTSYNSETMSSQEFLQLQSQLASVVDRLNHISGDIVNNQTENNTKLAEITDRLNQINGDLVNYENEVLAVKGQISGMEAGQTTTSNSIQAASQGVLPASVQTTTTPSGTTTVVATTQQPNKTLGDHLTSAAGFSGLSVFLAHNTTLLIQRYIPNLDQSTMLAIASTLTFVYNIVLVILKKSADYLSVLVYKRT